MIVGYAGERLIIFQIGDGAAEGPWKHEGVQGTALAPAKAPQGLVTVPERRHPVRSPQGISQEIRTALLPRLQKDCPRGHSRLQYPLLTQKQNPTSLRSTTQSPLWATSTVSSTTSSNYFRQMWVAPAKPLSMCSWETTSTGATSRLKCSLSFSR